MLRSPKQFFAKILLFGEYTLLAGSEALIVPYKPHSGILDFKKSDDNVFIQSNLNLLEFSKFLFEKRMFFPEGLNLDIDELQHDIANGLCFVSDIPQNYGLGSSGALVASVYYSYSVETEESDLTLLRNYFSFMESYFHGNSSGIDPLCCYIAKPLRYYSSEKIEIINHIKLPQIFLLNTEISSKTGKLVNLFREKISKSEFKKIIETISYHSNKCIQSLTREDVQEFNENIKTLSLLQLKNFSDMIPANFIEVWREGLKEGGYFLKLCGSGGGGYLLGFSGVSPESTHRKFEASYIYLD